MEIKPENILDITRDEDFSRIYTICNALGNPKRLEILRYLQQPPYKFSITELSNVFNMPMSTIVHHLKVLEDADLIHTSYRNNDKKNVRIVTRCSGDYFLHLYTSVKSVQRVQSVDTQIMPVGNYTNFYGKTLYFVTKTNQYRNKFSPERFNAQLIYTPQGIIEYYFDNSVINNRKVNSLSFSLEMCSEAPFFDSNHKSDITFWINDIKVVTHRCEGDYGDRVGNLNPDWWPCCNTQYGKMVNLLINEQGVSVNGMLLNTKVKIDNLRLHDGDKISLKFGNESTAEYVGGFNVFGCEFGDYSQDIVFNLFYQSNHEI